MRIRVARKMYNPVVEAGQGAYYGNLVNPISDQWEIRHIGLFSQ